MQRATEVPAAIVSSNDRKSGARRQVPFPSEGSELSNIKLLVRGLGKGACIEMHGFLLPFPKFESSFLEELDARAF